MKALIIDGEWISRAGLAHLLSLVDGKCSIKETDSLAEAIEFLAGQNFDICLVDPALPEINPLEVVRRLRGAAPEIPIAVVSDRESRHFALQAIESGAQAFILKRSSADDIRLAVERVLAGEMFLPAKLREMNERDTPPAGMAEAAAPFLAAEGRTPVSILTPRQRDVLGLIATGKRNAEIARVLEISPRTVQIHVSTILKLLGVGNRTEAALLARKHGLGG
ncbi:MAG: Glycerol metabolism activator [Pseudomonadota bacterium]